MLSQETLALAEAEPDGPGHQAHALCFCHTACDYLEPGRKPVNLGGKILLDFIYKAMNSLRAAARLDSFWSHLNLAWDK